MKRIFLSFLSLMAIFACHAQNEFYQTKNGCDLACQLGKSHEKHIPSFLRQSLITTAFVKFEIDSLGHVSNIECSMGTPDIIADFAREAVQSTDGNWLPFRFKGQAADKTTFLLPIIVNLQAGTNNDTTKKHNAISGVSNMLYFGNNITSDKPHFGGAITPSLNCIILNPYFIESVI
jgi:hypothetical protein